MIAILPALFVALVLTPPARVHKRGIHPACSARCVETRRFSGGLSRAEERILRRQTVRLAKIAMLERRHASLQAFVLQAAAERMLFQDARIVVLGPGLELGPAAVSRDFIGSTVIRARVSNTTPLPVSLLLTALVKGVSNEAEVSASVELPAGAAAQAVLLCPPDIVPTQISWSAFVI